MEIEILPSNEYPILYTLSSSTIILKLYTPGVFNKELIIIVIKGLLDLTLPDFPLLYYFLFTKLFSKQGLMI
jgi:hypothetical protein